MGTFDLLQITDRLSISFRADKLGIVFGILTLILWVCTGFYSISYMKEKASKMRFYVFYWLLGVILVLMGMAANLFTYYMTYELMTLVSVPLVMQDQTKEAIGAGVKYLIYSFVGAYLVLFGLFVLNPELETLTFVEGGSLNCSLSGNGLISLAVFFVILGFGVKAGMWPMHAWLPTAHPVAPSPASAVLSGMIVKAGALGIIRSVFYVIGADKLRGTSVNILWLVLVLITIFLGSMQAYREPLLKKRLAYSTVSQVSYVLFGIALLNETAFNGAMLQFAAHAVAKCALFLIAGTLIKLTGRTLVTDFKGIGKRYPVLMWCFIISSLSLIGIPPTGGFLAKWYLCVGALETEGIGILSWLGPIVLLVSALLTAGYLLPLGMKAFLPGKDYTDDFGTLEKVPVSMLVPIIILTFLSVLIGFIPVLL